MEKDIKILLVPDVHGRTFWEFPVTQTLENNPNAKILFLGDYLDPYDFEEIYPDAALRQFKTKILPLKKQWGDRVIMLLGNHDLGYLDKDICSCRHNWLKEGEIHALFDKHGEDFLLAYEETIGGTRFVFSHAGFLKKWVEASIRRRGIWNEKNLVDCINNHWLTSGIPNGLEMVSSYRGGLDWWGSPVWADVREHVDAANEEENYTEFMQVFGHTMLRTTKPLYRPDEHFCCIDNQVCFYIDSEGVIRDYYSDKPVEPTTPHHDEEDGN